MIGCLFILSSCSLFELHSEIIEEPVDAIPEVVPHYDEIEELLAQAELEAGLGDARSASSTFARLMLVIEGHDITEYQRARVHTLEELLSEVLANREDPPPFTGSAAAAKVMTYFGVAPDGYEFVYHGTPSQVGTSSVGFYVFLVPTERYDGEFEAQQVFFVTNQGEILTIE